MYAIVTDGSKQLKVEEGQVLNIDYRPLPAGETITFDRVLAIGGEGSEAAHWSASRGWSERHSGSDWPDSRRKAVRPKVPAPQEFETADRSSPAAYAGEDQQDFGLTARKLAELQRPKV